MAHKLPALRLVAVFARFEPLRRTLLEPSETGRALTATGPLTGRGVAPLSNNTRPCL
ncbi:MAG: hypothetical protein LBD24_08910 [Spirochaetaceae bacterium]|nr:hypothetical protein [Spirochaetaceae bacterium]